MKLDRNLNEGLGKYALLDLRLLSKGVSPEVEAALEVLNKAGVIQWGLIGEPDEFFVMKLKDINSPGGLAGYATEADKTDPELATEVRDMLPRAGINSPFCKKPD